MNNENKIMLLLFIFSGLVLNTFSQVSILPGKKVPILIATAYNSGFAQGHTTWNALSTASDGKIYYVLSTDVIDVAAQMYSFDPRTKKIEHLGDLSEICGEKGMKVVPQGKSHVNFVESKGKLYFSTHVGYFDITGGKEELSTSLSNGYKAYRGGHLIAFDIKSKNFEDLGRAYKNEGIIDMNMDTVRGLIYGVLWPTGYFFRYDLEKKEFKDFGPFTKGGEAGTLGKDYRVICRSIVVNQEKGDVYITTSEGQIISLELGQNVLRTTLNGANMRKDYFGKYNVLKKVTMGYNWRQAFWYSPEKVVYGVHGNSGYLFRFDPSMPRVEVLDKLTSLPSQLSGMNDNGSYGYLGFELGPDGHTIYYFTGSPTKSDSNAISQRKVEDLHLISYDIPTRKYTDYGLVNLPNGQSPREVQSIAITKDAVYGLGTFTENGKTRIDLFSIPNPLNK